MPAIISATRRFISRSRARASGFIHVRRLARANRAKKALRGRRPSLGDVNRAALIAILAVAANLAENLTKPASCIWHSGSIRFWPSNMSGMRHYRHRPIVRVREDEEMRRIEPRQLLTEDVQVDVGRGRMTAQL